MGNCTSSRFSWGITQLLFREAVGTYEESLDTLWGSAPHPRRVSGKKQLEHLRGGKGKVLLKTFRLWSSCGGFFSSAPGVFFVEGCCSRRQTRVSGRVCLSQLNHRDSWRS